MREQLVFSPRGIIHVGRNGSPALEQSVNHRRVALHREVECTVGFDAHEFVTHLG